MGYSREKKQTKGLRTCCFENPPESLRFFNLTLGIPR